FDSGTVGARTAASDLASAPVAAATVAQAPGATSLPGRVQLGGQWHAAPADGLPAAAPADHDHTAAGSAAGSPAQPGAGPLRSDHRAGTGIAPAGPGRRALLPGASAG